MIEQLRSYSLKGKYSVRKKEAAFQKELFNKMKADGFICYHIEDTSYGYRFLDGICVSPSGFMFGYELKIIDKFTFNFNQFEDSQIALMDAMLERNCAAYVGIFSLEMNQYQVFTYEELKRMKNERGGVKLFTKNK